MKWTSLSTLILAASMGITKTAKAEECCDLNVPCKHKYAAASESTRDKHFKEWAFRSSVRNLPEDHPLRQWAVEYAREVLHSGEVQRAKELFIAATGTFDDHEYLGLLQRPVKDQRKVLAENNIAEIVFKQASKFTEEEQIEIGIYFLKNKWYIEKEKVWSLLAKNKEKLSEENCITIFSSICEEWYDIGSAVEQYVENGFPKGNTAIPVLQMCITKREKFERRDAEHLEITQEATYNLGVKLLKSNRFEAAQAIEVYVGKKYPKQVYLEKIIEIFGKCRETAATYKQKKAIEELFSIAVDYCHKNADEFTDEDRKEIYFDSFLPLVRQTVIPIEEYIRADKTLRKQSKEVRKEESESEKEKQIQNIRTERYKEAKRIRKSVKYEPANMEKYQVIVSTAIAEEIKGAYDLAVDDREFEASVAAVTELTAENIGTISAERGYTESVLYAVETLRVIGKEKEAEKLEKGYMLVAKLPAGRLNPEPIPALTTK